MTPWGRVVEAVYEVEDLTKEYRQGRVTANRDLSFEIYRGEIFGLLGPNGAGKTTLVRQLVGLLKPTRGRICLFGEDITAAGGSTIPHYVAYLAQKPLALAEVFVEHAVVLTGHIRGLSRDEALRQGRQIIGRLGLEGVVRKPIRQLSGGQQRLVTLALALIGELPVLILDEPTNELDPENRRVIWDLLLERNRRFGTTIILVTHNVLEAERVIQRVGIINQGRIMALGTVGELKARVDQRVRLELLFAGNGPAPQQDVEPPGQDMKRDDRRVDLVALTGGEVLELGRNHYVALVDRHRLQPVIAAVLDRFGLAGLDDFRILTPSLEDVYLQLGGGKDLVGRQSA